MVVEKLIGLESNVVEGRLEKKVTNVLCLLLFSSFRSGCLFSGLVSTFSLLLLLSLLLLFANWLNLRFDNSILFIDWLLIHVSN